MELIPVLDLMHGAAVHARRGVRSAYGPVVSQLIPGEDGDALALARAYRTRVGAARCYVADIDAIEGRALQFDLIRRLTDPATGFGSGLLVDAAVSTLAAAERLLGAGVTGLVIGLETLGGFEEVREITRLAGGSRVIFSLDLLDGKPVREQDGTAGQVAARAAESGCGAILVLDLAAVGSEAGPRNLRLIAECKRQLGLPVYTGGGIRSAADVKQLEEAGCDAVLVGTALHAGDSGLVGFRDWGIPGLDDSVTEGGQSRNP